MTSTLYYPVDSITVGNQELQQVEVVDTTEPLYSFCSGKRILLLLDGENISISAKRSFDQQPFRIDFDTLAVKLQRICAIADLHVCASGTSPDDVSGGPYPKPWNLHILPVGFNDLKTLERKGSYDFSEDDKEANRWHNADPMIFYTAGQLLPHKRYQTLIIGSGDGGLGCSLAKIAKKQFGDEMEIITLSLGGGSTSFKLDASKNKDIAANFEIGYDLFVPFDQPRIAPKPTLWQQVGSYCYNLFYA